MKKVFLILAFLALTISCTARQSGSSVEYTLVTYNVENLFDADGKAIYDDYNTTDSKGNELYTSHDVLTKVKNAVQVLRQYNNGKGPDIAVIVELESDYSPVADNSESTNYSEFLTKYSSTTLDKMLGTDFNAEIADLPSEFLLLKGMVDAGMWNYELATGDSPKDKKGLPTTVQKTAVFSRFPILAEKTKIHPLYRARPILETWVDINGSELAVFANHWKSGAGNAEMEEIRVQNAQVLRARLDELVEKNEFIDFVLAGDFNSDYNQKQRYGFSPSAINDVLMSGGSEVDFIEKDGKEVYNLWYEVPVDQRGSDTYRGYWGTLMQLIVSKGMYDKQGISYVDNSLERGDFDFNTYSSSGEPKRWSSTFTGSGYSDHLPISMKIKISDGEDTILYPPLVSHGEWKPIPVVYTIPTEFLTKTEFNETDPTKRPEFYDEYFYLPATVTDKYDFVINGRTYDVYTPSFRLNEVLSDIKGTEKEIRFYGRFSQYRGNWQFIVESPEFLIIE